MITFELVGHFTPYVRMTQASKWSSRSRNYLDSQKALAYQYKVQMKGPKWHNTPLCVSIEIFMPNNFHKCDLDNQVKALLDAAKDIVFSDDRWVDSIIAKRYKSKMSLARVTVQEAIENGIIRNPLIK